MSFELLTIQWWSKCKSIELLSVAVLHADRALFGFSITPDECHLDILWHRITFKDEIYNGN